MNKASALSAAAAGKRARTKAAEAADAVSSEGTSTGAVTFYSSSEARKLWSRITKQALNGENVAIIVGKRAVALREVSLTYAEMEYGIKAPQIHAKATRVESKANREIDSGKARRIV